MGVAVHRDTLRRGRGKYFIRIGTRNALLNQFVIFAEVNT